MKANYIVEIEDEQMREILIKFCESKKIRNQKDFDLLYDFAEYIGEHGQGRGD